ncbi:MAG TPA: hypothetical protein GX506_07805 [Firmicutes bacterium]|nr:hypothetical protein [Bacillota bacterium]
MSGASFDWLRSLAATLLAGFAIKLMDDYLDHDMDRIWQKPSLYELLGDAILPYAIIATSLGCALSVQVACPLVLGAYVAGMARESGARYPSGLTAACEAALVSAAAFFLFGARATLSSVALMFSLQLADDLVDYSKEHGGNRKNFVNLLGKGETLLLAICLFLLGLILDRSRAFLVLMCAPVVMLAAFYVGSRSRHRGGD